MLSITVGRNGEDYFHIQEAIDAVPYDTEAEILVSEGVYQEKLFSDKRSLTVRGSGNVYIVNSDSAREIAENGRKRGTFRSYTAFFSGCRLHLENLTIANGAGTGSDAGQAIALYLDAEDATVEDVRLLGHQDTLFLAPLPETEREKGGFYGPRHLLPRRRTRSVFRRCHIRGSVDFIFGGGDALFEECTIESNGEGFVAAPSGKRDWTGFVFSRSLFVSSSLPDGSVFLMRPWRPEGKCFIIDCAVGSHVDPRLRTGWGDEDDDAVFKVLCSTDEEARELLLFFRSE